MVHPATKLCAAWSSILLAVVSSLLPFSVISFTSLAVGVSRTMPIATCLLVSSSSSSSMRNSNNSTSFPALSEEDSQFLGAIAHRADQLAIEESRQQLEDANTRSFLKRKPRKLPYEDARTWVQKNLGPQTEDEFYDLVENGNLRTPYIPKQPEEYYTRTREWISWDHFLTSDDQMPSSIAPRTGIFD